MRSSDAISRARQNGFEKAIGDDPDSPESSAATFLMEVSVGHFDRALTLAPKELKLDPGDAVAQLVLLSDRLKSGDAAGALKYAAALPSDGGAQVHRAVCAGVDSRRGGRSGRRRHRAAGTRQIQRLSTAQNISAGAAL